MLKFVSFLLLSRVSGILLRASQWHVRENPGLPGDLGRLIQIDIRRIPGISGIVEEAREVSEQFYYFSVEFQTKVQF